jgi:hypothetical protein
MLAIWSIPKKDPLVNSVRSIIGGTLVLLSILGCSTQASDGGRSADTGKVLPTIQERLSQRVVTGTLVRQNGSEYVVREAEGSVERTVRVDQRTKLDPVTAGETVRIYITEDGRATTLQRIPK